QTLLKLLAVIVGFRILNLRLDLRDPPLDLLLLAGAVDDRGVLLLDAHALGLAEPLKGDVLELDAEVLGNHRAGREDGDVFEHRLATIAEPRSLDRRNLEAAAQLVDHERGQRLSLNVFG